MLSTFPSLVRSLLFRGDNSSGESLTDVRKFFDGFGTPSVPELIDAYHTNGIAARIVDLKPEETWQIDPKVKEKSAGDVDEEDETPWEEELESLVDEFNLWAICEQVDKDSRIGRYGVVLLGINDASPLDQPVSGYGTFKKSRHKLTYINTFSEENVIIRDYDKDPNSPRYGLPSSYTVTIGAGEGEGSMRTETVHWHRVVHVAEGASLRQLFATPALTRLFRELEINLPKLLNSSFEAYWQTAFPTYFLTSQNGVAMSPDQKETAKKEIDGFIDSMKRWLLMGGMDIKPLQTDWKDPTPGFEILMRLCAITEGCPVRTFIGAEEGQLAGDQNTTQWSKRIQRRRIRYAGCKIVRPLISALVSLGVLGFPANGFKVEWKNSKAMTDTERATYAKTMAEALTTYTSGNARTIIPFVAFLTKMCGFDQEEAEDAIEQASEEALDELELQSGMEDDDSSIPPDDQEEDDATDTENDSVSAKGKVVGKTSNDPKNTPKPGEAGRSPQKGE